jgi:probable HAF family extracellular repeat protein
MTALPLLGGNNGYAGGINNRGQIVGVSETPNSDPCSFAFLQVEAAIWENGRVQELPPFPGDSVGNATAINDSGQAVGATGCVATNTVRAVLWPHGPNGRVIDLGNLGGTTFNIAFGINNRGQVVGQSNLPSGILHAFLRQNGIISDLGFLPGLPTSIANAINNQGLVGGDSQDANGDDFSAVAWIWQNGVMTDLNTLIPPGSPLFLMEALSINDRGEIAGFGSLSNGDVGSFLLVLCDKNHPGVEGCDYSMVDTPAAVALTRPAVRNTSNRTLPQSLIRRMNRYRLPGHAFGPRN